MVPIPWRLPAIVGTAVAALLWGCGEQRDDGRCAPYASVPCECERGVPGTARCVADGSAYGPCRCEPAGEGGAGSGEGGGGSAVALGGMPPHDPYRDPLEIRAELEALAAEHPRIAELVDYGDSFDRVEGGPAAGYDLLALHLTNKSISRPKPVFFLVAGIHGDEIVGPEIALRLATWLAAGYDVEAEPTWLVDQHELWIVATANPDSLGIQRCNANDVDLNRNHSFQWVAGAAHGDGPASEPEVMALEALVSSLWADGEEPTDDEPAPPETTGLLISLHAPYGKVAWPWGWSELPAPNAAALGALGAALAGPLGYDVGQTAAVVYPIAGCTTDWVYGTFGVPALLLETGPSKAPSSAEIDQVIWPGHRQALLWAAAAARDPYRSAWGPVATLAVPLRDEAAEVVRLRARLELGHLDGGVVAGAELSLDALPWSAGMMARAMVAIDGAFDGPVEEVEGTVSFAELGGGSSGRHLVFVRGRSDDGAYGPPAAAFVEPDPR